MTLEAPNPQRMGPRSLTSAHRQLRVDLRARKLLMDTEPANDASLDQRTRELEAAILSAPLTPEQRRRASTSVAWLAGSNQLDRAEKLLDQLLKRTGRLGPRLWWIAVTHLWRPDALNQLDAARPKLTDRQRARYPHLNVAGDLAKLPSRLATEAVQSGLPIHEVLGPLRLPPGSRLGDAVLEQLTTEKAFPWLASHSRTQLRTFLSLHHGTIWVGRVGRALLTPIHRAGASPGDVAATRQVGLTVGAIHEHLPNNRNASAWTELGDEARELIRWWSIQRDLMLAFEEWQSEPERLEFWRRYIRSVSDIEAFKKANALGIRLGDVWYVEVGRTGYATYVFPQSEWAPLRKEFLRASHPGLIRDYRRERRLGKLDHRSYWQSHFESAIARWSFVRPDGR